MDFQVEMSNKCASGGRLGESLRLEQSPSPQAVPKDTGVKRNQQRKEAKRRPSEDVRARVRQQTGVQQKTWEKGCPRRRVFKPLSNDEERTME